MKMLYRYLMGAENDIRMHIILRILHILYNQTVKHLRKDML
jgi:hypothetical protein